MISRYNQADVASLWTEESKFHYFYKVELALLETWEEFGVAPAGTKKVYDLKVKINPDRVHELEKITHHDVIAFCTSVTEQIPEEQGKWFHFGCTSSDVIDTALSLQMKDSLSLVLAEYKPVLQELKNLAQKTKHLVTIGRSHGMYAEPMSFGQKFLLAYAEFSRRYRELEEFMDEFTGQMSGAVGSYTVITPQLEETVMRKLQLKVEPLSTQVINRDYHAKLVSLFALWADALERFEIEIRHLHRSDVAEVAEGFSPGQKGSSTMPHKKNPIAAENLCGIARVIRSYQSMAHENTLLWHERDISHSSAERIYLPELFNLAVYALRRLKTQLTRLEIHEDRIKTRAEESYHALSSYYLHTLLPHWPGSREQLYAVIQACSFKAKNAGDFQNLIKSELTQKQLEKHLPTLHSLSDVYLKHVDKVFERVFSEYPLA
jgi:adenylosuccinate lyase